jgi:hypothetical protein
MKALHLFLAAGAALALTACGGGADKLENIEVEVVKLNVDTENSTLGWMGSKNPEYFHTGNVKFNEGQAEFIDGNLISGTFSVDLGTMASLDAELPDEKKAMLVGHLSSPDFFDALTNAKVIVKCGAFVGGKLPIIISMSGKEIKQDIDAKVMFEDGKGSITGKFDVDFSPLGVAGFQPKEGETEHVLPVISFDLNLLLK